MPDKYPIVRQLVTPSTGYKDAILAKVSLVLALRSARVTITKYVNCENGHSVRLAARAVVVHWQFARLRHGHIPPNSVPCVLEISITYKKISTPADPVLWSMTVYTTRTPTDAGHCFLGPAVDTRRWRQPC